MSLPGLETATVGMLEAAGICPAWIYAYQHTGGLLPRPDGSFASGRDQAEWDEVISRYVRVHQPGTEVNHEAETRKLQNIMTIVTLQMAADDHGYGEALATQLAAAGGQAGSDSALLREYLRACADDLGSTLRSDHGILWRQVSTPGRGVAPASPADWKPRREPGQAIASLMTSFRHCSRRDPEPRGIANEGDTGAGVRYWFLPVNQQDRASFPAQMTGEGGAGLLVPGRPEFCRAGCPICLLPPGTGR